MNRITRLGTALAAVVGTFILAGCGKSSNPVAPEVTGPAPVTINTPTGVIVSSIAVTKWPAKTTSNQTWDISLFAAAQRPDLYVVLTVDGRVPDYSSNVVTDAEYGKVYTFTQPYSVHDGRLPATLPYDTSRRVYLMDQDVGGDPDRLGWITLNLPNAYGNDNASSMDYTFTDSGRRLSVRVRGTWTY